MKLILLKSFLEQNTDESHGVTLGEITEYLSSNGIRAERKSLYDDIELLRDFDGMDIALQKKRLSL